MSTSGGLEIAVFSALTVAAHATSVWAWRCWPGPLTTQVFFSAWSIFVYGNERLAPLGRFKVVFLSGRDYTSPAMKNSNFS